LRRSKASEGAEWTILQELAKTAKCPKKPFFLARFASPVEKRRRNFASEKQMICQCANKA
jgi:hypothetical protein